MFSSIKSRILFTCLTIVVAALLISTAINYIVACNYKREAVNQNLNTLLAAHDAGIEEWVASKTLMIQTVANLPGTGDPTASLKQIASAGNFSNVYIGYADKTSKFADPTGVPADYDPTSRPWYKQAAQAGKPVVTSPYVDIATGKLVVTFSAPIIHNGVMSGVASGNIVMDSVVASIKAIHPSPGSFGLLVDRSGFVVAAQDSTLALKQVTDVAPSLSPQMLAVISEGATAPVEMSVFGRTKFVHARSVPGTDWLVVIAIDEADTMAGMHLLLLWSLAITAAIAVVAAIIIGIVTTIGFMGLARIQDAMEEIGSGSGDLTQRLPDAGNDEVSRIAQSFNRFVGKINEVMLQIHNASEAVKHATSEIAAGNSDLSRRTESAAASLQQTAAAVEEIASTVAQSAASARQANDTASTAASAASHGGRLVSDVVVTMQKIEGESAKVSEIIGVIEGIAFQTNILALNAAVEAARAGEEGRGFAVVAGEVRTLAQRSAQAAREIKDLIDSSVSSVSTGATLVQEAGEAMKDIVGRVSSVTTIMSEITNAADEQTRGIQEVNRAVAQLDEMVQQNAALVEQSAAAASALESQARELAYAVGQFRVANEIA